MDKPRRKAEIELLPDGTYEVTLVQWMVNPRGSSWDERRAENWAVLPEAQASITRWFKGVE